MTLCMGDSHLIVDVLKHHFGPSGGPMHTGVEIGVHRGATSAKLLAAFPQLSMWLVDPYLSYPEGHPYRDSGDKVARLTSSEQHQHYEAAKEATKFAAKRRTFCRFPSLEAVKIISAPRISFAFIDGDHTYEATSADCDAWWPKVEARGLLSGHDYGHKREVDEKFGVSRAVNEFAEKRNLKVNTLGSVWWFVKP